MKNFLSLMIAMLFSTATLFAQFGNTYNTVLIGSQYSMEENLVTAKYNNDNGIPLETDNTAWENFPTHGYCWYNNDKVTYGKTYGTLYNWYTVNTVNLCPIGWHEPTDAEWITLTTYLGGLRVNNDKLKKPGTVYWNSPNMGATNESGYTILPGSTRWYNGDFIGIGIQCYMWSAIERVSYDTWRLYMSYTSNNAVIGYSWKMNGSSVRCLRD